MNPIHIDFHFSGMILWIMRVSKLLIPPRPIFKSMMMTFQELTDEQWEYIKPHLPPQPRVGRKRACDRKTINDILYVLNTGCTWHDMPRRYGSGVTAWRRLKRWSEDGTWERIHNATMHTAYENGIVSLDVVSIDSTLIEAKNGGELVAYNDHKKKGVKVYVAVCSTGLPLSIFTGLGSQHDSPKFIEVIGGIEIKIERGRPRTKPDEVVADATYDNMKRREYLRRRNICSNIWVDKRNVKKTHVDRPMRFEEVSYKKNRSCIERVNCWIKTRFRRIALRYERLESCFRGLLNIACFLIFWTKLQARCILKSA